MAETSIQMAATALKHALQKTAIFADLSESDLDWLVAQGRERVLAAGESLFQEGHPADTMYAILEGELHYQRSGSGSSVPVYIARAGEVSGMLPFSRMTHFAGTGRAMQATRLLCWHSTLFPEMLQRIPVLNQRFVWTMADRIREATRVDQQQEKLLALGKLSAGLAHELNNPAAAIRRAADTLTRASREHHAAAKRFYQQEHTAEQRRAVLQIEQEALAAAANLPALDVLERADREDAVAQWLERRNVQDASHIAGPLAESGIDPAYLTKILEVIGPELIADVATKMSISLTIERVVEEIQQSSQRIFDLVTAIKEYSYMDQTPLLEIDVHRGLENTLTMFAYRTKHGVEIVRDYDPELPKVCAYGSELNQVWTNLIDNALDAMGNKGRLEFRTRREPGGVCVEIADDGPGIPADVRSRIFDPFFTTKPAGKGTGLGLDMVQRIIRKHNGTILLDSKPGETRFQVRLPLVQPKNQEFRVT